MYKSNLRKCIIFVLLFFIASIGFSSWVIVGTKNDKLEVFPVSNPVCYINFNEAGNQYTRIEKALEDAYEW